jgi:hypothetical protein
LSNYKASSGFWPHHSDSLASSTSPIIAVFIIL